jgi:type I site-specific restriction endonuclease
MLKPLKSLVYDSTSDKECEIDNKKMKTLIYCSANDTLRMIEGEMVGTNVDYARITSSSASTHKKVMNFRNAKGPTSLLANSWGDAAGIDFKMATDIIILNYIESKAVVQQMLGRLLRIGQNKRARVTLISFTNERHKWLQTYVVGA